MIDAAITLIVRETGWSLEYIREQPVSHIQALLDEITHQKASEAYQNAYNSALIVCALISSRDRHYKPEDIIGQPPERRTMDDILTKTKLDTITLADGKEYTLAPVNMNILTELEERFDKSIDDLFSGSVRIGVYKAFLYARIKRNYPDMTEDQLGELITDDVLLNLK